MKNTLKQVFRSPRFVIGFGIFVAILVVLIVYPLFNPGNPLQMIGVGTFAKPGTYFSLYDAVGAEKNKMNLPDAAHNREYAALSMAERVSMVEYLTQAGVPKEELDFPLSDTEKLVTLWRKHFDPAKKPENMTQAQFRNLKLLTAEMDKLGIDSELSVADKSDGHEIVKIQSNDYVNLGQVLNTVSLPLGTDNFGRDTLKELVSATGTSILIGLVSGTVATLIGLALGLLAGYIGGAVDDIISFFTNVFTVIPGFVLLILISFSLGQDQRGAVTVALVIGFTGWPWTARSVRAQVISLRNRDHVSLSRISGHGLFRIILSDILPYIASYVVMAFILQVSSGILSEAQLSLLGLGPKTTEMPTLGLMMNWAMLYKAHIDGSWWAYFPVILTIASVSFSLNLMNTGLDQVFNPALRD